MNMNNEKIPSERQKQPPKTPPTPKPQDIRREYSELPPIQRRSIDRSTNIEIKPPNQ